MINARAQAVEAQNALAMINQPGRAAQKKLRNEAISKITPRGWFWRGGFADL